MSAKKFLELLLQSGLLDDSLVEDLRRQVSEQKATAAAVAKHLVDRGHLTKFQATKFVGQATAPGDAPPPVEEPEEEEELGLAPLDDDPEEEQRIRSEAAFAADARRQDREDEVIMLEDAGDALQPVEDVGDGLTPVGDAGGLHAIGPDEPPLGDLLSDVDTLDSFDDLGPPPPSALPRRRVARGNVWESKLMIGGGLALLLLVILFVVLFMNLSKTPAVEMWAEAMEYYRTGSYTQAQVTFEEFLEDYPDDENASEGRVRVALCKIRVVISDAAKGLDRSQSLLPDIESEEAFTVARDELGTLLVQIPEGFVRTAKGVDDLGEKERLVALAEDGMELVNNPSYVPSSLRAAIRGNVDRVVEDISLVHRDINRDRDLAQAIQEIDEAAAADRTAPAYQIYRSLVKKYPSLGSSGDLIDSVKRVSARQRELVQVVETDVAASRVDTVAMEESRVEVVYVTGEGVPQLEGQTLAVPANGSVYGLSAGNGHVIWSRSIGHGDVVRYQHLGTDAGSDLLLVNSREDSLMRVTAADGELVWRLDIGEAFSEPTVVGSSLFVSSASGRLLKIDSESGDSERHAVIPQELPMPAAPAPSRPLLFQVGSHSNLYVISTQTLECEDVYYVGHQQGSIRVPPVVHLGHVFLAENAGDDYALLRVLAIESSDGRSILKEAQPPIRLPGNVIVPLELYGRRLKRLLAVTDRGAIEVFDVDVNRSVPVSLAAAQAPTLDEPLLLFPRTDGIGLWIASDRLTRYRVQVTTKSIQRQEITNVGDTFTAAPQLVGNYLVHVRRPKQGDGVRVSAISVEQPRAPLWQTRFGSIVNPVAVDSDSGTVQLVTSDAALFEVKPQDFASGYVLQPVTVQRTRTGDYHFREPVALPDGRTAVFNPVENGEVLVFDSSDASQKLKLHLLDLPVGKVTCRPVALGDRLLLPMDNGEVVLRGVASSEASHRSFRPRTQPGEVVQWSRPAVVSDRAFVIADDRRQVYRVEVTDSPEPHLGLVLATGVDFDIASPLAAAEATIYGIGRSSNTDTIVAFDAEALEIRDQHQLDGARVTWGPEKVGGAVVVVADDKHIYCFDEQPRWAEPAAAYGRLAGPPLVTDEDFVFVSTDGVVWRVSKRTGQEVDRVEVGVYVMRGPVAFGEKMLLCGSDGAIYVVDIPAAGD